MSENMNFAPTSPDEKPGDIPDGWSEIASESAGSEDAAESGAKAAEMTRDERIADGKEKIDALKSKVKAGLGNMLQKLKDGFYIGVSRGAELPGQIAEKSAEAKEAIGNTWAVAKEKAAELFGKGRDFIVQKKQEALDRKAKRQRRREERIAKLESRQAERDNRQAARRAAENVRIGQDIAGIAADRQAEASVMYAHKVATESLSGLRAINMELGKAREAEQEAYRDAFTARQEAEAAKARADQRPGDESLRLVAEEKAGLSVAANARLKQASLNTQRLQERSSQLSVSLESAAKTAESAKQAMEARRQQAEGRKAERKAARKEARGDAWESAKDRVKRVAEDDPNWIKRFGAKALIGSGRLARKVVSEAISAGSGMIESMKESVADGQGKRSEAFEKVATAETSRAA